MAKRIGVDKLYTPDPGKCREGQTYRWARRTLVLHNYIPLTNGRYKRWKVGVWSLRFYSERHELSAYQHAQNIHAQKSSPRGKDHPTRL